MRRPRFIDPFQPAEVRRLVREFGSPLLILDCERVRVQLRKLKKALPRVELHYALKPLPHPAVVATVLAEGAYLDLATSGEVQLAQRLPLRSHKYVTWINAGRRPEMFARDLYTNLRTLDKAGCQQILVQAVPDGERWDAIRDRLLRAASSVAESDDGTGTRAVLP